jgi:Cu2+-exporting ATPase
VESALKKVPGVKRVQVSAASHRAQVEWSQNEVTPSQWIHALAQTGYQALPAHDAFVLERRKREMRRALWRWLVAGLCMMQIMMYAFPSYDAQPGDLTPEMEQLLRWASWVLSLPIMFFSSGVFFSNAWRDLKLVRISMDLPVAVGIAITFVVSTMGTFEPAGAFGKEVYFDSLSMFVFFLLTGRLLELRMRDRTAGALDALMNRLPQSVEWQNPDGQFERIVARRVAVGDVLRVQPGEAFVADGVILQGHTAVDEALLTGESHPLERSEGGWVIAGSHNLRATVTMQVKQVGESTRFAEMVALMEDAATSKPSLAQRVDRIAPYFLLVVLLAALAAGVWHWSAGPGPALMVAVSILIVTCPCALALATPAAMLASAGTLARGGVLLRHLQALETLSGIDTVVFDKTGTLTEGRMTLQEVATRSGVDRAQALLYAAALAQHSHHPVSQALLACAKLELPEASNLALHAACGAVHETPGQGIAGVVQLLSGQGSAFRLGSATFCGVAQSPAATGLMVYLSDEQGWLATFTLQETLRAQAREVVQALQQAGLSVHLLSGDRTGTVQTLAQQLGIAQAQGECSPTNKLQMLKKMQESGHTVAMVGDGLNDGPVLAGAHVSFALGQAVPLAQARSDFVLLGGQLQGVWDAVLLSRRTLHIVRQNLLWSLIYNAASVPLAIVGLMPAWLAGLGMALSSLLVVMNALRLSGALPAMPQSSLEH